MKYNNWLKTQPQVAKKYDPDDYKGYICETLTPKLENIIQKKKTQYVNYYYHYLHIFHHVEQNILLI